MSGPLSFKALPWDSELFGFPVARLESAALDPSSFPTAMEALRQEGVRLAYAAVPWNDALSRDLLENSGASMVDRKIRYRKQLEGDPAMPAGIGPWPGPGCTPELEALALASGHQSRFHLDPRVPRHVFPQLYLAWIRRSVLHEIADDVLVSLSDRQPAGLVTLKTHEPMAEIGLVAVAEAQRGQGLGRRLMAAAEASASARGARALEVVTQGANAGACALYAACGYAVAQEQAVYHVWMENP